MPRKRINLADSQAAIPLTPSSSLVISCYVIGALCAIATIFFYNETFSTDMDGPTLIFIGILTVAITVVPPVVRSMTRIVIGEIGITWQGLFRDYYLNWEDVEWAEVEPALKFQSPLIKPRSRNPLPLVLARKQLLQVMAELGRRGKEVNHYRWTDAKTFDVTSGTKFGQKLMIGYVIALLLAVFLTVISSGSIAVAVISVSVVFFFVGWWHRSDKVTISPVAMFHHGNPRIAFEEISSVVVKYRKGERMLVAIHCAIGQPVLWLSEPAATELKRHLLPEQWAESEIARLQRGDGHRH